VAAFRDLSRASMNEGTSMIQISAPPARAALIALLLGCAPAQALAAEASKTSASQEAASIEDRIDSLKPGEFIWQPDREASGPVEIVVSLPLQKAFVYRGGTLIGATTVSSGKTGHETPVGGFRILEKRADHRSSKYNSAAMPFMQRLNWYGVALHGGAIPGHPASHGCVRLPMKFAQKLFGATAVGASVYIAGEAITHDTALAVARAGELSATAKEALAASAG